MDDPIQMPIVIYDDKCSLCSMFAKMVSFFGCGRISLIGHYSKDGLVCAMIIARYATEMFWLCYSVRQELIFALLIPQSCRCNGKNMEALMCMGFTIGAAFVLQLRGFCVCLMEEHQISALCDRLSLLRKKAFHFSPVATVMDFSTF